MKELPPGVVPAYRDIRYLPPEEVGPFLRATFDEARRDPDPELDRLMLLGGKARGCAPETVNGEVLPLLGEGATPKDVEIAANFLAGYWTHETRVPAPLLDAALKQLDKNLERRPILEFLLLSLSAVHHGAPGFQRGAIHDAFARVAGALSGPPLQPFAATALNDVLTS